MNHRKNNLRNAFIFRSRYCCSGNICCGKFKLPRAGVNLRQRVAEIALGNGVFGKTMILAAIPALYSILIFAVAFLISNKLN